MGNFQRKALNAHSLESEEACLVRLATSQMLQEDLILVYLPGFKPISLVVSTLRKYLYLVDFFVLIQALRVIYKVGVLIHC